MYAYGKVRAPIALLNLQNSSSQANSVLALNEVFLLGNMSKLKEQTNKQKTDYNHWLFMCPSKKLLSPQPTLLWAST